MKKKPFEFSALLLMAGALAIVVSGCGGGSGQTLTPAGNGRVQAQVSFEGTPSQRARAAGRSSKTGSVIGVDITISGVYSVTGTAFDPVVRHIDIDASTGEGSVAVADVPIGVNHLLTAVATYPGGGTETVKGLIDEVAQYEVTSATADPRSTPAAEALMAEAEDAGKGLHEMPFSRFATFLNYVDQLYSTGTPYSDITAEQVLSFEGNEDVPSSVVVSPAEAMVYPGRTQPFSAVVRDQNGLITTAVPVVWTVEGTSGAIDSSGLYTAGLMGSATVTGTAGSASDSATVLVVTLCSTDSDCNDGAALTVDSCLYPGTTSEICQNLAIACNVDADCAGSTPYCVDGGTASAACIPCNSDSDCDDGSALSIDSCSSPGTASAACVNAAFACNTDADCGASAPYCINGGGTSAACIPCNTDVECNDGNTLTIDACVNGGASSAACAHTPCPVACSVDLDCDDSDSLTIDSCSNAGTCSASCSNTLCPIACTTDPGCDDGDTQTLDECLSAGTCASACSNTPIACGVHTDCNDSSSLTLDVCSSAGTLASACLTYPISCSSNADCGGGTSVCIGDGLPSSECIACETNSDCDDGNAMTVDACSAAGASSSSCSNVSCGVAACSLDSDCDDLNDLTIDACGTPASCDAACSNAPIDCNVNADCDDLNGATIDACINGGTLAAMCVNI